MEEKKQKNDQVHLVGGMVFKNYVLNSLNRPQAMPMLCVWYDIQNQWCFAVGDDLKSNAEAKKSVGLILFRLAKDFKLFDEIGVVTDKGQAKE